MPLKDTVGKIVVELRRKNRAERLITHHRFEFVEGRSELK